MQSSLCSATSTEAWAIRVIFAMQSLEIENVACYQAVSLHQPATDRLFALTCAVAWRPMFLASCTHAVDSHMPMTLAHGLHRYKTIPVGAGDAEAPALLLCRAAQSPSEQGGAPQGGRKTEGA